MFEKIGIDFIDVHSFESQINSHFILYLLRRQRDEFEDLTLKRHEI